MSTKPKRYRLTDLVLSEVSLVDRPANPLATVLLFKRDSSKETNMSDELKLQVAKQAADILAKDTEIAFLKGNLEKATTRLAETETALSKAVKLEDKPIELPPEAQAQIKKALDEAAAATTALAKMRDDHDTAVFTAKAANLKSLPQKAEEFGPVLKRIAQNKASPEDVIALETILKAADAALAKGLLTPAGNDSGASSVAADQLDAIAKKIAAEEKTDFAKAYVKAVDQNPALYSQYVRELQS